MCSTNDPNSRRSTGPIAKSGSTTIRTWVIAPPQDEVICQSYNVANIDVNSWQQIHARLTPLPYSPVNVRRAAGRLGARKHDGEPEGRRQSSRRVHQDGVERGQRLPVRQPAHPGTGAVGDR